MKRNISIVLTMVMLLGVLPISNMHVVYATDSTFDKVNFEGHSYQIFDLGMTWHEAKDYCENLGGHLATVTLQTEQDFLELLIQAGTKNCYWLGGSDDTTEGDWQWVTGEFFSYTNWSELQPDNYLGTENFLMVYCKDDPWGNKRGKWNDLSNEFMDRHKDFINIETMGFICEWDNNKIVQNNNYTLPLSIETARELCDEYYQIVNQYIHTSEAEDATSTSVRFILRSSYPEQQSANILFGSMVVNLTNGDAVIYDDWSNEAIAHINLINFFHQPSSWAKEEVDEARELNLIPEDLDQEYQTDITRLEFCRLAITLIEVKTNRSINNFLLSKYGVTINDFNDTDDYYVLAANELGIVFGIGNNLFAPDNPISRQEAAIMLMRTANILGLEHPNRSPMSFDDANSIASWAKASVDFVTGCLDITNDTRVMSGTGSNCFSPLGNYTREQAFLTFKRLYNVIITDFLSYEKTVNNLVKTPLFDTFARSATQGGLYRWEFNIQEDFGLSDKEAINYDFWTRISNALINTGVSALDFLSFKIVDNKIWPFEEAMENAVDELFLNNESLINDSFNQGVYEMVSTAKGLSDGVKISKDMYDAMVEIAPNLKEIFKTLNLADDSILFELSLAEFVNDTLQDYINLLLIARSYEIMGDNFESFVNQLSSEVSHEKKDDFVRIAKERINLYKGSKIDYLRESFYDNAIKELMKEVAKNAFSEYTLPPDALVAKFAATIAKTVLKKQIDAVDDYYQLVCLNAIQDIACQEYTNLYNQLKTYEYVSLDLQKKLKNTAIIYMISGNKARDTFISYLKPQALSDKDKQIWEEWKDAYEAKNGVTDARIKMWLSAECR